MTPKWLTKITNQGTRNSPLPLALRFTHKYANALSLLPLQGGPPRGKVGMGMGFYRAPLKPIPTLTLPLAGRP
jgi:hypothetical protein